MRVEQFVMAYGVEHDRLRAILPDPFTSLRPVLRINAEVRDEKTGYIEFNTAIQKGETKGWLNIGFWEEVPFIKEEKSIVFHTDFLDLSFSGVGIEGSCPAEKDNQGCYFLGSAPQIRLPEQIAEKKEFCDCRFAWRFDGHGAHGVSIGKTLPAIPREVQNRYPRQDFTVENAAAIPCEQVLGAYLVKFERLAMA